MATKNTTEDIITDIVNATPTEANPFAVAPTDANVEVNLPVGTQNSVDTQSNNSGDTQDKGEDTQDEDEFIQVPSMSNAHVWGMYAIRKPLAFAITRFMKGIKLSNGDDAFCKLSGYGVGDYQSMWSDLPVLKSMLLAASKRQRTEEATDDCLILSDICRDLYATGLSSETCLEAFAFIQNPDSAFPERYRTAYNTACAEARKFLEPVAETQGTNMPLRRHIFDTRVFEPFAEERDSNNARQAKYAGNNAKA